MITKEEEIRVHKAIKADTVKANIEQQLKKIESGEKLSPSYFQGLLQAYLEQLTIK